MFVEHKEVGEVAEAPAKITKLSEAIRIGAKLRPQAHHEYFRDGKSCALGAAYEAVFDYPGDGRFGGSHIRNGMMLGVALGKHFGNWFHDKDFDSQIGLMNDGGMSREQIADWVEAKGH